MFGPCLLRMNTMWYNKSEQPLITASYQSMIGFAAVIQALLAYGALVSRDCDEVVLMERLQRSITFLEGL